MHSHIVHTPLCINISRVPDQNGVSLLYIMLQVQHSIYIYIYIYMCVCVCVCIYIYIYIYICIVLSVRDSWSKRAGHNKAQILYYIAENLENQKDKLVECLETMTGQSKGQCEKEVETALERLFFWAAYCDKYGGSVQVGVLWRV